MPVPGSIYRGVAWKTTDSGNSWNKFYDKDSSGIGTIGILDQDNFILSSNELNKTTDGGLTWSETYLYDNFGKLGTSNIAYINKSLAIAASGNYVFIYNGKKILKAPDFILPNTFYNAPVDLKFEWTPIQGAKQYHLQIFESEGRSWDDPPPQINYDSVPLIYNDSLITGTFYNLENSKYYKTYQYRIKAVGVDNQSPWIEEYCVTTNETGVNDKKIKINKNIYLDIYPNPCSDFINICYLTNESININYRIFNELGIEILSKENQLICKNQTTEKINLGSFPTGTYYIQFFANNENFVKPFLVLK
jgi:hypothetical protein